MYSMKETCIQVGMSYQTLKFYCNEGLVPNVKRDRNNYRLFDENDINWLKSLSCLKKCGMGIQEMKAYIELCLKGQQSIPERKIILEEKKSELLEKIKELEDSIAYINWKQQFYDDVLSKKIKYYSHLIKVE